MTAGFLGGFLGVLVAAALVYTYARHVIFPKMFALSESLGLRQTMHGVPLDGGGPVAMPAEIGTDPCAVSAAVLDIRRTCSCTLCKALVGYEDEARAR